MADHEMNKKHVYPQFLATSYHTWTQDVTMGGTSDQMSICPTVYDTWPLDACTRGVCLTTGQPDPKAHQMSG